jgi:hypothetical protein
MCAMPGTSGKYYLVKKLPYIQKCRILIKHWRMLHCCRPALPVVSLAILTGHELMHGASAHLS